MLVQLAVLLLSLCTVPWPAACAAQKAKAAGKQQQQEPQHYFWNEITNEVQWEGETVALLSLCAGCSSSSSDTAPLAAVQELRHSNHRCR
jgi:hypothetical protein